MAISFAFWVAFSFAFWVAFSFAFWVAFSFAFWVAMRQLELKKGDTIHVTKKGTDGWCLGCNQRTKKEGMFPAT